MLPSKQVGKSQRWAAQLPVQPDTEIVQGGLGRHPGLKAFQLVRAFPVQPEGMVELVEDSLHHLAYPSQPSAQFFGPGIPAVALGRTDYPGSIAVSPPLCRRLALKAFVHYIPAPGWFPQSGQPGMGSMPEGEEVFGQGLVFDASWGKAEAGDDALGIGPKAAGGSLHTNPGGCSSQCQPARPANRRPGVWPTWWEHRNCPGLRRDSAVLAASPPSDGRKPPGFRSGAGSAG